MCATARHALMVVPASRTLLRYQDTTVYVQRGGRVTTVKSVSVASAYLINLILKMFVTHRTDYTSQLITTLKIVRKSMVLRVNDFMV